MREGDIALTLLLQADGQMKARPALLLRQMRPFGDWLVCGVSSRLRQQVADFDEIIDRLDDDFAESGLRVPSLIRLGFLATLPEGNFLGRIGSISAKRYLSLRQRLADYLGIADA